MKIKLLFILLFSGLIFTGCSKESATEQPVVEQEVIEQPEAKQTPIEEEVQQNTENVEAETAEPTNSDNDIESIKTTISENEVHIDIEGNTISSNDVVDINEITYYDYGYVTPKNITLSVNESVVSIYNNEKDITDKYSIYYWVDKNSKIDDSTSMVLKEGINSIAYSNEDVDDKWEYIFFMDDAGNELNSSYETRVLKVHYTKDGEQLSKKFIMCVPKDSLYYRRAIETEESTDNVLTVSNKDSNVDINLKDIIYSEDAVSGLFSNDSYSVYVVEYEALLSTYEEYCNTMEFLTGALVIEPVEETIVMPLDKEELHSIIESKLTGNLDKYLKSVEDGKHYEYIIFTYGTDTYETLFISNDTLNINELDLMSYINAEEFPIINVDNKTAWLAWNDFCNNEELANKAIEASY